MIARPQVTPQRHLLLPKLQATVSMWWMDTGMDGRSHAAALADDRSAREYFGCHVLCMYRRMPYCARSRLCLPCLHCSTLLYSVCQFDECAPWHPACSFLGTGSSPPMSPTCRLLRTERVVRGYLPSHVLYIHSVVPTHSRLAPGPIRCTGAAMAVDAFPRKRRGGGAVMLRCTVR